MQITLNINSSNEYFRTYFDMEPGFEDDSITMKEADDIGRILACEVAIYALRRCCGPKFCGSNLDTLRGLRRSLINIYELTWGQTYEDHNNHED